MREKRQFEKRGMKSIVNVIALEFIQRFVVKSRRMTNEERLMKKGLLLKIFFFQGNEQYQAVFVVNIP